MAITVQPPSQALAANRRIVFIASIVTALNVQYARVRLREANGTPIMEFNVPINIAILGGFIFVIDIQQAIKQRLSPYVSSTARITNVMSEDPTAEHVALNTTCYQAVFINVDYFYRLPNGTTAPILGLTDTSDVFSVFAAHLQQNDTYDLLDYLPDFGFGYRTLTRRPFGTGTVGVSKPFFVSAIINDTINAVQVTTVDSAGAPINSAIKLLPADIDAPYYQVTVGVGLVQLTNTLFDSGSIAITGNEKRVIVQFGAAIVLPVIGVVFTESTRAIYNVKGFCKDATAVCFLNELGGADVVQFDSLDSNQRYNTERQISQKAQNSNPLIGDLFANADRGRFALNVNSVRKFRLKATTESDAVTAWLASLINSPEIYFALTQNQRPLDYMLAVLCENSEVLISTPNGSREQVFEFAEANNVQIPSY